MKKFLALLLMVCMVVSVAVLAGCNNNNAPEATNAVDSTEAEATEAVEPVGALSLTAFSAKVGDYELNFEPIDLGGLAGGDGTYEFAGDFGNGKYYISDKGAKKLYVYAIDGTTATLENTFEFEKSFEEVSVNNEGKVILSQGIFEAFELNDDGTVTQLPYKHDITCSKDEDFAVATWVNADPSVIKGGEESEWVFKNINDDEKREGKLSMVFDCEIAGDHVLIGGTYKEDDNDGYRIGIFDFDGNELAMTAQGDSVGYTALNETENGIISANVGKLFLHDSDCHLIGTVNDLKSSAGFDSSTVSTFWVQEFSLGEDGDVYALIYVKKADNTTEALLYKVTGF